MRYEPCLGHPQLGDECATAAFVAVARKVGTAVELIERLEREIGKPEPGCPDLRFGSDRQVQPANRAADWLMG